MLFCYGCAFGHAWEWRGGRGGDAGTGGGGEGGVCLGEFCLSCCFVLAGVGGI